MESLPTSYFVGGMDVDYKKLAQAMRVGAQMHPQISETKVKWKDGVVVGTCALGAAYVGHHGHTLTLSVIYDHEIVKEIGGANPRVQHPLTRRQSSLASVITDLNDEGWTREAIADWLETL